MSIDKSLVASPNDAIMEEWGYTGSVCIPMALDDARERGLIMKGALTVFVGSGVGYQPGGGGVPNVTSPTRRIDS